jgi:hypothetical protein
MRLFAQHGYGEGQKIIEGLQQNLLDGIIYSPRDISLAKLRELAQKIGSELPATERLFDPQFYATLIAVDPTSRLGYLEDDYAAYFGPRRYNQLISERQVTQDIRNVLEFQLDLPLTSLIAPNIIISRSIDSAEAAIAMEFIRNTGSEAKKIAQPKRVYATLAIARDALINTEELLRFLNDITVLDDPPDGFYILIATNNAEARADIFNADVIAAWMLINHTLAVNGFDTIDGYSDLLTSFLGAAGAEAGATGWWSNLRTFSLDRFSPPIGGGRQPVERYLSCSLLNRITFYELDVLRQVVPRVLNALPTDSFYPIDEGSQPQRNKEVLQSWEAIKALNTQLVVGNQVESLQRCQKAVKLANNLYAEISLRNVALEPKSTDDHVGELESALASFERLAELDLS